MGAWISPLSDPEKSTLSGWVISTRLCSFPWTWSEAEPQCYGMGGIGDLGTLFFTYCSTQVLPMEQILLAEEIGTTKWLLPPTQCRFLCHRDWERWDSRQLPSSLQYGSSTSGNWRTCKMLTRLQLLNLPSRPSVPGVGFLHMELLEGWMQFKCYDLPLLIANFNPICWINTLNFV